jgi:hypothetical protein
MRCDYQDRYPEPCTRCARTRTPKHCYIDPSFKRKSRDERSVNIYAGTQLSHLFFRESERFIPSGLVPSAEPVSADGPSLSSHPGNVTSISHQPLDPGPLLVEGPTISDDKPPQSMNRATAQDRSIGSICLVGDEITLLFQEYYTRYHPFFPLFVRQHNADDLFNKSQFIFWTICVVASRPYAGHPVFRCRSPDFCREFGNALLNWMYFPMAIEGWKYWHVQAWLLLAQYPPLHEEDPDNLVWVRSSSQLFFNKNDLVPHSCIHVWRSRLPIISGCIVHDTRPSMYTWMIPIEKSNGRSIARGCLLGHNATTYILGTHIQICNDALETDVSIALRYLVVIQA